MKLAIVTCSFLVAFLGISNAWDQKLCDECKRGELCITEESINVGEKVYCVKLGDCNNSCTEGEICVNPGTGGKCIPVSRLAPPSNNQVLQATKEGRGHTDGELLQLEGEDEMLSALQGRISTEEEEKEKGERKKRQTRTRGTRRGTGTRGGTRGRNTRSNRRVTVGCLFEFLEV